MKKNIMLAALMMVSTIIFAQKNNINHQKMGRDRKTELIKKQLLLTDDQYAKVNTINSGFRKQLSAIRRDTGMTQGKARVETKRLMADHKSQMRAVLNDPQWAKYTAMTQKKRGSKKYFRHGKGEQDRGTIRG